MILIKLTVCMENRLLYISTIDNPDSGSINDPDSKIGNAPASALSNAPEDNDVVPYSLSLDRSKVKSKSNEEREKVKAELDAKAKIDTFTNAYNGDDIDKNVENFEIDSKELDESPDFWEMPINQEKTKPDFKNWDYNTDAGLAKVYVEMDRLGIDVNSSFYKSVFAILRNGNRLISSGYFDSTQQTYLFSNPAINEAQISQIDDKNVNFNGKLYLKAVHQIVKVQQSLLKNVASTLQASEPSYGEKQGSKINGFVGDIVSDVQSAVKEKNIPKLLMYGLGGFLAYKGGEHIWKKPVGKGMIVIGGLASLLYLTGHGKWFEKFVTDAKNEGVDKSKDMGTWILEKFGADEESIEMLKKLGITKDNVSDVLGGGLNSMDNLEYVLSMSSDPNAAEVKDMGVDEEMLLKIKDVNLNKLYELSRESDSLDPGAKFIPPNHELIKEFFPEFATISKNAVFRKESDLKEIKEQSSIIQTGGFNSQFSNYVDAGKMLYNMVMAMKIGYGERIQRNDSKYNKLNFEQALNLENLKDGSVGNYLDALREYTNLDNSKYLERTLAMFKDLSKGSDKYNESLDLKILKYNTMTGVSSVLLYGMPFKAHTDPITNKMNLYLSSDLDENKIPDQGNNIFMTLPDDLENGVFTKKFGEIVMADKDNIQKQIPKGDVEVDGVSYKRKDMVIGDFVRDSGTWVLTIVSKSELDKGNNVVLYMGEVTFTDKAKAYVEFNNRLKYKQRKEGYLKNRDLDNLNGAESFEHIQNVFTNFNVLYPQYKEFLNLEAISFNETTKVYKVRLNGLLLKAKFDSINKNFDFYLDKDVPDDVEIDDTFSIFLSAPYNLNTDDLKNKYFDLIKNDLEIPDNTIDLGNGVIVKKKDKIFSSEGFIWNNSRKMWSLKLFSSNTPQKQHVQTLFLKFDDDNKLVSQVENSQIVLAAQEKIEADLSAELAKKNAIEELNKEISSIERPFDQMDGGVGTSNSYTSPFNFEILEYGNKISIKTHGNIIYLARTSDGKWNFESRNMEADGGYSLQQAVVLADLANKVSASNDKLNELDIFYKNDEFVVGNKTPLGDIKFTTFLSKDEVVRLKLLFSNWDECIDWTQHVIDRARGRF